MKAKIPVLIVDVKVESLNFRMGFVEKLSYCNLEQGEVAALRA